MLEAQIAKGLNTMNKLLVKLNTTVNEERMRRLFDQPALPHASIHSF